jgi:hypothetical protein
MTSRNVSMGLMAGLWLALTPGQARAVPAPMSPEKLLEKSDVVATVRVVAIVCTQRTVDPRTGEVLCSYRAQLRIMEVKNGSIRKNQLVWVTWHDIPTGLLGPWSVAYYLGEEVTTHLVKDEERGIYTTLWWNAKGKRTREPHTTGLPKYPGQVLRLENLSTSGS